MSGFIQGDDRCQATLSLLQFLGILRSKLLTPLPNGFIGQRNTAFSQQFFHFAEAQTKAVIQPHGVANNFGRETMSLVTNRVGSHTSQSAKTQLT